MPRVKRGTKRRARRKKILDRAEEDVISHGSTRILTDLI